MKYIRKEIIGDCTLYLGDSMEIIPQLAAVNAVITDPPYGTTQCSWDVVIPFKSMWSALDMVSGRGIPIILFGCEPFSSLLRTSNIEQFKYDWVWDKPKGTGFLNSKKQPLRGHEIVSVFCDGPSPYYPQKTAGHPRKTTYRGKHLQTDVYGQMACDYHYDSTERYPRSVITFSSDTQNTSVHPTQKPVSLLEYLVLTYTQVGQTVLDFTMGSGTTGVACVHTGRSFIGIEIDEGYFDIACERIRKAYAQPDMFVIHANPQEAIQEDIFAARKAEGEAAA
ncbi:DNA-methyltransferase [Brucellaceae bacterium D45D]